jgi:vacuolar-type H+-ATPase subunit C/Vma6
MASIYVEHIHLRLSEINDIPYPDNLYMLMEALEGYGVIYEHSKYFLVEENQICVDEEGAVKVWVNSDLSINYPAIFMDGEHNLAEEDMAEAVINLIADNTDT